MAVTDSCDTLRVVKSYTVTVLPTLTGGSAMAVTAADVVLLSENLLLIPGAVRLCQVARAAMLENCQFAIGIKIVAIVLALLGECRLSLWLLFSLLVYLFRSILFPECCRLFGVLACDLD